MPKYLVEANYVGEGIRGLLKDGGTGRRAAVEKVITSLGGKIEAFYYAFGDVDLYGIVDMPDDASMVAFSLTASGSGMVTLKTTPLLDPEVIDGAGKLSLSFRPPGA